MPPGWLLSLLAARAEMGADPNGVPLASERFRLLDEEGITDPELRRVARRIWSAADRGYAEARQAELERLRQRGG